jgi:hypothetical protein
MRNSTHDFGGFPRMTNTSRRPRRLGLKVLLLAASAFAVLPATDAFAGRLLVTGHDWDYHCTGGAQCHYTKVGVKFVRAGSTKKVLVLDTAANEVSTALNNAFSPGFPRRVVAPTSAEFKTMSITTKKFSAILVASDASCGGCDLNQVGTEDSDAIFARRHAIAKFFNAGGGIMTGAGGPAHGSGTGTAGAYYRFVPIPVGGEPVSAPFTLTKVGKQIGFKDDATHNDINCCPTHNSFKKPGKNSALKIAEKDSQGFAETLVAKGKISGGQIVSGGGALKITVDPRRTREDRPTCFAFKVTSDGKAVRRATVHFGGTEEKTNRRGRTQICKTFADPGRRSAKATKKGFTPDRVGIRVVRAPGFTG